MTIGRSYPGQATFVPRFRLVIPIRQADDRLDFKDGIERSQDRPNQDAPKIVSAQQIHL